MRANHVHVIACGVLAVDMRHAAKEMDRNLSFTFLKGGLHEKPKELRRQLQEAIDEASQSDLYERIVIGYGICGRGTVEIEARDIPLVIPRVHDCIALFLGSDAAYQREFKSAPGTFYFSAGWQEEKAVPLTEKDRWVPMGEDKISYEELQEKHGVEAADAVFEFLSGWEKNYQRAVFIDTGVAKPEKHISAAKAAANHFGWRYEKRDGDLALIRKLLTARQTDAEVLVVPPGYRTTFDPAAGRLEANPLWQPNGGLAAAGRKRRVVGRTAPATGGEVHRVLGIDVGGTYTDIVVFDLQASEVLGKSKAPTTKWDFTVGITEALAVLDSALLKSINVVSLSTTLATNAIVEDTGQKVGLLVMPPYGLFEPSDIPFEPKAAISGQLEISGEEREPVDEDQIRRLAARMVERDEVKAFAVSGFAGTINPDHEVQVKRVLRDETGLPVSCGHELSDLLDFKTRAQTAVMNSRIIPLLAKLISDVEIGLQQQSIDAPVVVVRGDGSLMSNRMAQDRPVETILSGPAASVTGARYLTGLDDACVVDIGGTTTDIAQLREGRVDLCSSGSDVGGFRTHVKALEIRTTGLGGDSSIVWHKGEFSIGPRRVAPIAWLAAHEPDAHQLIDEFMQELDWYTGSTRNLQILASNHDGQHISLSPREREILTALDARPQTLRGLARQMGLSHPHALPLARLEEHFLVQRCGFTPTDLLNVSPGISLWDDSASARMCEIFSRITALPIDRLVKDLHAHFVRQLATEILKKHLSGLAEQEAWDDCELCRNLIEKMLDGGGDGYDLNLGLHQPVVGIGAPTEFFLEPATALLGGTAVVPEHAEVANAVGAATSQIDIRRQVRIKADSDGSFFIEGVSGGTRFSDFDESIAHAENELVEIVQGIGLQAGTTSQDVELAYEDHISTAGDGIDIFLGRTITAELTGAPDGVVGKTADR